MDRLLTLTRGWIESDFCARISAPPARLLSELPISLQLDPGDDSILRGFIDLLAEPARGVQTVIDFKTNRLGERSPDQVAADYELQAWIYALAVARARRLDRVDVAFVLLERPGQPVILNFDTERLKEVAAELSSRVAHPSQSPAGSLTGRSRPAASSSSLSSLRPSPTASSSPAQ